MVIFIHTVNYYYYAKFANGQNPTKGWGVIFVPLNFKKTVNRNNVVKHSSVYLSCSVHSIVLPLSSNIELGVPSEVKLYWTG